MVHPEIRVPSMTHVRRRFRGLAGRICLVRCCAHAQTASYSACTRSISAEGVHSGGVCASIDVQGSVFSDAGHIQLAGRII